MVPLIEPCDKSHYTIDNIYSGLAHDIFLEFQKIKNHLEFWKKLKNSGTWKNLKSFIIPNNH